MSDEVDAMLELPAPQRYRHFIEKVVGLRRMWGLYADGWAMSETPEGRQVLPLWPAREYAERNIADEWSNHQAREIDLDAALAMMIPTLREQGILPGIFFSPDQGSINITLDELERDLRAELARSA
jgi:Protein of unknown function (DUF2750)